MFKFQEEFPDPLNYRGIQCHSGGHLGKGVVNVYIDNMADNDTVPP